MNSSQPKDQNRRAKSRASGVDRGWSAISRRRSALLISAPPRSSQHQGKRIDTEEFFLAYEKAAHDGRMRALPPEEFVEPFKRLCSEAGIRTSKRGGKLYLMDVSLRGESDITIKSTPA